MPEKIYGPRIKWDGGERPVSPETRVKVKFRDGYSQSGHPAYAYYWRHDGDGADIVEYCTIIEQTDLEAAEKLLRDNGYTVTPPAKQRQTMNDKTEQAVADDLRLAVKLAAPYGTALIGVGHLNDAANTIDALHLLKELVAALDETYWSSWQTTAKFDNQLTHARNFVAELEGRDE